MSESEWEAAVDSGVDECKAPAMAKQVKKSAAESKKPTVGKRRQTKPDQSQIALSVVERAIGGKLANPRGGSARD